MLYVWQAEVGNALQVNRVAWDVLPTLLEGSISRQWGWLVYGPRVRSMRWSASLRVRAERELDSGHGGVWGRPLATFARAHVNSAAFWIIGHGALLASQAMACEVGNQSSYRS